MKDKGVIIITEFGHLTETFTAAARDILTFTGRVIFQQVSTLWLSRGQ